MRKKLIKLVAVVVLGLFLINMKAQEPTDYVYIIAGGKIESGNIDQMVLQLYINKKKYKPIGLLSKDFNKKRPSFADADYIKLDSTRHGYVVWQVSKKDLTPTSSALIYLTSLASSNPDGGIWWYSCFRSMRAGGRAPISATDDKGNRYANGAIIGTCKPENANWTFLGCSFKIEDASSIYYAGDFNITGDLKNGIKTDEQIALIKETSSSDTVSLKPYLKTQNLTNKFKLPPMISTNGY